MTLDHLWSTWRSNYVSTLGDTPGDAEGTLFERILAAPEGDREKFVVARGRRCFALLNLAAQFREVRGCRGDLRLGVHAVGECAKGGNGTGAQDEGVVQVFLERAQVDRVVVFVGDDEAEHIHVELSAGGEVAHDEFGVGRAQNVGRAGAMSGRHFWLLLRRQRRGLFRTLVIVTGHERFLPLKDSGSDERGRRGGIARPNGYHWRCGWDARGVCGSCGCPKLRGVNRRK